MEMQTLTPPFGIMFSNPTTSGHARGVKETNCYFQSKSLLWSFMFSKTLSLSNSFQLFSSNTIVPVREQTWTSKQQHLLKGWNNFKLVKTTLWDIGGLIFLNITYPNLIECFIYEILKSFIRPFPRITSMGKSN
jgi:hypothetical protein